MKTKRLFILSLVFIFIISLASCKEKKKDNNKDNYSPYVLKPDADTSLLGGSPWLDLSRDGAIDIFIRAPFVFEHVIMASACAHRPAVFDIIVYTVYP